MKPIVATLTIALTAFCWAALAQEVQLNCWQPQTGTNVQVGQTDCAITVTGLNAYDQSDNLTWVPLQTNPSSVGADTQITDTLYAVAYDGLNTVTAMVMYQADPSQSIDSAVQDTINHNNWANPTPPTVTVRAMNPSESVPAGTQFWVCSASGQVAFTGSGRLCVAEPAIVQDLTLFPPVGLPVYQ